VTTATKLASSKLTSDTNVRRDELITEHLHLVTAIAAHVQNSVRVHIEFDDLVHAGTIGLFDAATKYQDDKEVAFATYAKHRIRGAILDSMRQQDWASRDLRKRYKQMDAVTNELTTKLGRTPTEAEVASAMGLNTRRWQALMVDFRSLNAAAPGASARERRAAGSRNSRHTGQCTGSSIRQNRTARKAERRHGDPARTLPAGCRNVLRK